MDSNKEFLKVVVLVRGWHFCRGYDEIIITGQDRKFKVQEQYKTNIEVSAMNRVGILLDKIGVVHKYNEGDRYMDGLAAETNNSARKRSDKTKII